MTSLVVAWLATYALHSTVVLGLAYAFVAHRRHAPRITQLAWRAGMLAPIASTSLHLALTHSPSGALELASRIPNLAPALGAFSGWSHRVAPTLPELFWRFAFVAWLAGALVGLSQLAVSRVQLQRRLRARRTDAVAPRVRAALREIVRPGESLPRLSVANSLDMPVALWREICLPGRALASFDDEQLRAVLAHEAAHVRHHDHGWQWATAIARRLLFFQPLVHLAARRLHEASECLADDDAVARTGTPVALASALAAAARWLRTSPLPAPMLLGGESLALHRVRRLVEGDEASTATPPRWLASFVVLAACVVPALAVPGVHPWSSANSAYTIHAADPAGLFTVRIVGGIVRAAAIDGRALAPERIRQHDQSLVLVEDDGSPFALELTRRGISWEPRAARPRRPVTLSR